MGRNNVESFRHTMQFWTRLAIRESKSNRLLSHGIGYTSTYPSEIIKEFQGQCLTNVMTTSHESFVRVVIENNLHQDENGSFIFPCHSAQLKYTSKKSVGQSGSYSASGIARYNAMVNKVHNERISTPVSPSVEGTLFHPTDELLFDSTMLPGAYPPIDEHGLNQKGFLDENEGACIPSLPVFDDLDTFTSHAQTFNSLSAQGNVPEAPTASPQFQMHQSPPQELAVNIVDRSSAVQAVQYSFENPSPFSALI